MRTLDLLLALDHDQPTDALDAPLRDEADRIAAKLPAGTELHVFENASHMGNIECADEFNRRVITFLKAQ